MNQYRKISSAVLFFFVLVLAAALNSCATPAPPAVPEAAPAVPEATGEIAQATPQAVPQPPSPPIEEAPPSPQFVPREPEYAEVRPYSSSMNELVVSFSSGEMELDFRKSYMANEAQFFTAIYEGLFSYHPITMEPVLAAASRAVTSEDKKQWTFTIRENARFSNGDPVRAEDFMAAWLSLLEPRRNSPYSSLFDIIEGARDYRLGRLPASEVGISAPNARTLVVRLNSPAAYFPSMLCHHSFSPIHPSMLNNEKWVKPVSNGPFNIEEIDDKRILLTKSGSYWDAGRVLLEKLTIRFSEDGEDAAAMWNSGEARWIQGEVNYDALRDLSGIETNVILATHYYFIRSVRKPWDDYRLRRALTLALPWEEMRRGYFLPAKTLILPIQNYPEIEGLDETDVEEAKALLIEAGYPGGVGLPELVIRITPSPDAERIALFMARAWYELGIQAKIDRVPYNRYLQSLQLDDYDVGSTTWIADFADPYAFLQMWQRDSNLNEARHDDSDFEALIEKSMTEEGTERMKTLAAAEELLLARGNVLPISYNPAVNIVDTYVIDGWYTNVLDIHPFKYMAIKARPILPGVV
ncbi:MAG: peptide ABC transporter substrate-binding protein [Treponema sp.]|jgi:peptide/nickel transport system substrate-binding protein/oligopeptide transport system substrate-binding protein|nr:peptide ABC transporter substrate-binding protein [Treponema sp.]